MIRKYIFMIPLRICNPRFFHSNNGCLDSAEAVQCVTEPPSSSATLSPSSRQRAEPTNCNTLATHHTILNEQVEPDALHHASGRAERGLSCRIFAAVSSQNGKQKTGGVGAYVKTASLTSDLMPEGWPGLPPPAPLHTHTSFLPQFSFFLTRASHRSFLEVATTTLRQILNSVLLSFPLSFCFSLSLSLSQSLLRLLALFFPFSLSLFFLSLSPSLSPPLFLSLSPTQTHTHAHIHTFPLFLLQTTQQSAAEDRPPIIHTYIHIYIHIHIYLYMYISNWQERAERH